jgi:hypothetical protein
VSQPNPSTAPGAPADTGTGGQAPTGTPPQNQPTPPAAPQTQDVSSLPDWAQKIITDTRAEAATHRTGKQTATAEALAAKQQRDAILKAAGFTPDGKDAPPDTEALAAQIEQERAVAWTTGVELSVFRTAQAAGVDGDKLLDSRAFVDSLDEFTEDDPRSPDFRTKLDAHIKAYVEKHPQFKTTTTAPTAPARAGSDRQPGSGGTPTQARKGLGAAIQAHYGRGG